MLAGRRASRCISKAKAIGVEELAVLAELAEVALEDHVLRRMHVHLHVPANDDEEQ